MLIKNPEVLENTAKFPTVKDLCNGAVFSFIGKAKDRLFIYSRDHKSITDLTDGECYFDDSENDKCVPADWIEAPIIPVNCEIVITTEESEVETDSDTKPLVTGIIRKIDDMGRIAIPKEIRRTLQIQEGDPIEISVTDDTIILKKY